MTGTSITWRETGLGWRGEDAAGKVLLLVNRAHRGGGFSWEFSALSADDDARGMTTTDASAQALAEKAYRRWLAGRLG
jgi:hypothetical protein